MAEIKEGSPLQRAITAVFEVRGVNPDRFIVRSEREKIARAVLQAIREPSEAVIAAALATKNPGDPRATWQAMIDAALEEG